VTFGAKSLAFLGLSIVLTAGGSVSAQTGDKAARPAVRATAAAPAGMAAAAPSGMAPAAPSGMAPAASVPAARAAASQGGTAGDRSAHAGAGAADQKAGRNGMAGEDGTSQAAGDEEEAPEESAPKKKRQAGCMGQYGTLIMLVAMFAIFYFMLIRPQQKKQKEHQEMLDQLKVGDRVLTQGGMLGKITGFRDPFVVLEIQEKVRIKVLRSALSTKYTQDSGKK